MAYEHNPEKDPNLTGPYRAMEYNAAGEPALRVIANANGWGIQVSNGDIDGVSYIEKFGYQDTVPNGDIATVWDGTGLYDYLDTATTVTVTSDNVNDNPTGTGARSVEIQGLDQDNNDVLEIVDLGGTSVTTFIRVFRARVCQSGGENPNQGIITVSGGGKTLAIIGKLANNAPGHGQTNMAIYTVPAGKTAYLTQWTVSSGKQNADTIAKLMTRDTYHPSDGAWNVKDIAEIQASTFIKDYKVPLRFTEKTDIEVRAFSSSGSSIASSFNLILIDNPTP
jgi:hypothetical protein